MDEMTLRFTPERFAEQQAKYGVQSVDELLQERSRLVGELADKKKRNERLAAKYAYTNALWDAERTIRKSLAMLKVKDAAEAGGKKLTDKVLEAMAHADPDYRKWVTDSFIERAQYLSAEADYARDGDAIDAITTVINRGQAILRLAASEPK